jgi:CBS domain containing-hemolysin-like protein
LVNQPRDPSMSWAVQRDDGSWLLDGHIPVPELKDRLGLDIDKVLATRQPGVRDSGAG